jgi:hypothetical protein
MRGAGIAAGPHCPRAGSLPGRRGVPRWAVSSRRRLEPGVRGAAFSGVRRRPKPLRGFPAGSPSGPKPWRFAARRIGNLRSRSHPFGIPAEAGIPERAGSSAEASVPPGGPWAEALGSAGCGALAEAPLSAGQVLDPKARCPARSASPRTRRPPRSPDGRFTKHAAFASAKGQARSFRLAAASSAALPPLRLPRRPEGR